MGPISRFRRGGISLGWDFNATRNRFWDPLNGGSGPPKRGFRGSGPRFSGPGRGLDPLKRAGKGPFPRRDPPGRGSGPPEGGGTPPRGVWTPLGKGLFKSNWAHLDLI